ILSAARLPDFVDSFLEDFNRLDVDGINLRDLGSVVNSDHRISRPVNRQQAAIIAEEQLQKIHNDVSHIMVPEANAYALPYVSAINKLPLSCSGFIITDECVPFYQM